jgi:hypothetical protein
MSDACPQCAALNGQTFENQDIFQSTLWSAFWGDIWDLDSNRPLTHGGTGINCRCQLQVRVIVDWDQWRALSEFKQQVYLTLGEVK